MENELLRKAKEDIRTKIFLLGLEMIFIFGLPAVGGSFLGVWLDGIYNTGRKITLGILFLTFVFSWVITIIKYQKLEKQLKELRKK